MDIGADYKGRIVHSTPGRLRIQFSSSAAVERAHPLIVSTLADVVGILSVEGRPITRSLVITYDPHNPEAGRIISERITAEGIEIDETTISSSYEGPTTAVGDGITGFFTSMNSRVREATGGFLDARDIFPLTLFTFGLVRVMQGRINEIPWYNLLYYGYSTFFSLHGRKGERQQTAQEVLKQRYASGNITKRQYRDMLKEIEAPAPTD